MGRSDIADEIIEAVRLYAASQLATRTGRAWHVETKTGLWDFTMTFTRGEFSHTSEYYSLQALNLFRLKENIMMDVQSAINLYEKATAVTTQA